MHGRQEIACVRVRDPAALVQQRFERRQEQRERRAQLMADVGEETTLDLVEFLELAVAVLELPAVLIQFVAQSKFTKAKAIEEMVSRNHNDARQNQEVEIIEDEGKLLFRSFQQAGGGIHEQHAADRDQRLPYTPVHHNTYGQKDQG